MSLGQNQFMNECMNVLEGKKTKSGKEATMELFNYRVFLKDVEELASLDISYIAILLSLTIKEPGRKIIILYKRVKSFW